MNSLDRPNILLMICHDLGCYIGPYGWAADRSPALCQLAQQSVVCRWHFVSSPGCSQSRSSLVTGRYPHANGQFGLAHLGWVLHHDEILLPAVLRQAGYRTVLLGIWHLHEWTLSAFDEVSPDVSTRDASPEAPAEIAGDRAARWLRENARDHQPFYLHVGFWETHRPFADVDPVELEREAMSLSDDQIPPFLPRNDAVRKEIVQLRRSVQLIDQAVARVVDALHTAGLEENTIVLFTADHGLPFPRAKGTLYDPGIHVALLVHWPQRLRPGDLTTLSSNVDVMPTLLEAVGQQPPSRVQGRSFWPLLIDPAADHEQRDAIFAEKTYHEHYDPMRCIRTRRWKYIRNFAARPRLVLPSDVYNSPTRRSLTDDEAIWSPRPPEELYDLERDPGEQVNRASEPGLATVCDGLRARLTRWMQETGDPLLHGPIPRPAASSSGG